MSALASSLISTIVRAASAVCVCAAACAGEPQAAPEAPRIEVARSVASVAALQKPPGQFDTLGSGAALQGRR